MHSYWSAQYSASSILQAAEMAWDEERLPWPQESASTMVERIEEGMTALEVQKFVWKSFVKLIGCGE